MLLYKQVLLPLLALYTSTAIAGPVVDAPAIPAPAVPAPAVAVAGDHCGNTISLYGQSRWTYAEVQVCIRLGNANSVVLKVSEVQYYWGGAWYYASAKFPWQWSVNGEVQDAGPYSGTGEGHGPSITELAGDLPDDIEAGSHTVTIHYHQTGPYWTDVGIDYDGSFTIILPS